jgi:PPOX class probable F420-dependent enzyme
MARSPLLNKTTATKVNALTDDERDAFLAIKQDGYMSTQREDGYPHLTPLWYLWDQGSFYFTLGASRRHLKNLRRDPHMSFCVDVDPRLTEGLAAGTQCVVAFGPGELIEVADDEAFVRDTTWRIMRRYVGEEATRYKEAIWVEPRTIVRMTPEHWLTWDQRKG